MKPKSLLLALLAAFVLWGCGGDEPAPPEPPPPPDLTLPGNVGRGLEAIDRQTARLVIETLADDSYKGRKSGTAEATAAARQIAQWMEQTGAKPFSGGDWFQVFSAGAVNEFCSLGTDDRPAVDFEIRNVLGMVEGENSDEFIVVGAHYDHIGEIETDSISALDKINNGADDNASGVAAVIQIARAFASMDRKPQRTVVFALWDGEEQGRLGSDCFVRSFTGTDRIEAYYNIDMIGRDVAGSGGQVAFSSTIVLPWAEILAEDIAEHGLDISAVTDPGELEKYFVPTWAGIGATDDPNRVVMMGLADQMPFYIADIDFCYVATGHHPQYHTINDEAELINYPKTTEITKQAFLTIWRLANPES